MHRRFVPISLILLAAAWAATAQPAAETDMPVAPIAAVEWMGWTNAYVLRNAQLEVAIAPSVGRILKISHKGGDNLLRFDAGLKGAIPDPAAKQTWLNAGGDWLWPVAQSTWPSFAGADWPPPPALSEAEWDGTAWKGADGAQSCLISREYGEPLHIKVSRVIKIEKDSSRITIRQRIERTADSKVPVTLWNITQIAGARQVVLPADADSSFENGVKALLFCRPSGDQLVACEASFVYDASSAEHKLGSDSKRGWIAARKGGTLVIEQARGDTANGTYPDGGCTVEMYSNAGLGYTEIETLSAETPLAAGEYLQNTLTIDCVAVATNLAPCELAARVREVLGETPPPATEPPPVTQD